MIIVIIGGRRENILAQLFSINFALEGSKEDLFDKGNESIRNS
jgi:hypothetical protein